MKLAKTPLALVVALVAGLSLAACKKPPEKQSEAERARAMTVVRVEQRPIAGALSASGNLIPREEAAVLPEVNGYRVARVLADVGQYVKAGQTLVQLDPALIQAQVAQAEANAAQAEERAQHRLAEAEQGARGLREQVAEHVLQQQRTADEELRRARTEGAALVAAAREEADELRAQARRIVEDARAEVALLARQRDGITQELGQLSGVIQALAVPTPTQPPTAQEPDQ